MLGHRGCRLSITYPEILEMQVTRRSSKRRFNCLQEEASRPMPEIMIPLIGTAAELETFSRKRVEDTIASTVEKAKKYSLAKLDIPDWHDDRDSASGVDR